MKLGEHAANAQFDLNTLLRGALLGSELKYFSKMSGLAGLAKPSGSASSALNASTAAMHIAGYMADADCKAATKLQAVELCGFMELMKLKCQIWETGSCGTVSFR